MRIKTIKYIFLGVSLLLFAVALGHFFVFERANPNAVDQYYLQSIEERIEERIKVAESELAPLGISLPETKGNIRRSELPRASHPYFLYRNRNIVYWSDNSFVPEFAQIKDIDRVGVLTVDGSEFIVLRHPVNAQYYTCVSIIPVYETNGSGVKFDDRIFSVSPDKISNSPTDKTLKPISSPSGEVMFYLQVPEMKRILQPFLPRNTVILMGFALLLFGVYCFIQIGGYIEEKHFGRAFILLTLFLILVRWLLLVNNTPLAQFSTSMFDPMPVAGSRWAVSLGDRIINCIILTVLAGFLATYFYRSTAYYFIIKSRDNVRSLFAVFCVVLAFVVSYFVIAELNNILFLSGGEYTYGLLMYPDGDKIVIFLYYLALSVLFFLSTHCCIYLFTKLFPNKVKGVLHWLYGTILSLILLFIVAGFNWIYLFVGVYFIIVYQFKLSRNFYVFRFKTSLYFFLAAFTFAIISTSVLHLYLEQEKKAAVQEIANKILSSLNAPFENSVIEKVRAIEEDQGIKEDISKQVLARERVVGKVKNQYFNDFVNGYQSEVYVFNALGENLDILSGSSDLPTWEKKLIDGGIQVGSDGILYKLLQADGEVSYLAQTQITDINGELAGSVIIELIPSGLKSNENRDSESNIYVSTIDDEQYSFAFYTTAGRLIEANGIFAYPQGYTQPLPNESILFPNGVSSNSYRHYRFRDQEKKRILVVSLQDKDLLVTWGNLSFLFLISVFAISGVLIMYSFYYVYKKRSQMNFTTRIQLSLNTAFLLPLLLVLIIAISVVGSTLRQNQESGFQENTSNLASTVQLLVADLFAGRMTEAYFQQEVENLAISAETNLTIYNAEGKQEFASEYMSPNLPPYLNPTAFLKIIDNNDRQILLNESISGESHLTSYVNVKPAADAEKMVVGVPYIGSKRVLEKQLEMVISSILNIFILLFVVLLLASFFVSRQLTNPIRTVTSHLRKTNLDKLDEPLPLEETNDEMGILVRAYNRMLRKLDESKIALSNSEKQTAWREMAKQVAHEIKNPLTPMKLSIQQLQRTLPEDNPKSRQRIERALNSLNEQVDNISEIANSFSEFAKMPVPRSEEFDLIEIIQKTADLYMTNKFADIRLNFVQPKLMVHGDRQLMSRVLTNLIINGLQSVPLDRRPQIEISAYKNEEESFAIVEVKDNGAGVPDEISEKVFIPNFSTKVGGSGLGLALAKRGIEHGGGNIWFETEINTGTTFYVDLPLAR